MLFIEFLEPMKQTVYRLLKLRKSVNSLPTYRELPVENLKAMALAKMDSQQLMAMAFETLALNSGKIGELNITPDLFSQFMKKGSK